MRVGFPFFKCAMESAFLTFILASSFAVYSSDVLNTEWDDVVVARQDMPTTLVCTDTAVRGAVVLNWMVKSLEVDDWKLLLSSSGSRQFTGGASKASMRLTDQNFQDTGVFSLSFLPKMEDRGLYSCMVKQQEKRLKERIILLAILTVTVVPAVPIPRNSILRLNAEVRPSLAISTITWVAPDGAPMKSVNKKTGVMAKLPQVQAEDKGAYTCMVHPFGNCSKPFFAFNVDVTINANNAASFNNIRRNDVISSATVIQTSFTISCPIVQGDYVELHWQLPDSKKSKIKLLYKYDRWRSLHLPTEQNAKLQLAGPPYNAAAGSFAFTLKPGLNDGGYYECKVFFDDSIVRQETLLSVLKVEVSHFSSKLQLGCLYTQRTQIKSVAWKYQTKNRPISSLSSSPGKIATELHKPITADTAGNYTCTLQLKNGQTVWITQPIKLPQEDIEQSVSVHSGEVENVYENPEEIRQVRPGGSEYMDLKPRAADDVYKELERCEECQS
ncbi:uncharacterized protein V6R79_023381 [Siganus canaliculatus]